MDPLPHDYFLKEYEFRIDYLKDHLARMWTRFNFFLIINTGLFAAVLNQNTRKDFVVVGIILGLIVSLLWNQFAATDNYLVDVYRHQVEHAYFLYTQDPLFEALRQQPAPRAELRTWTYTGATSTKYFDITDGQIKTISQGFFQRRHPEISATELGVVISSLYAVVWFVLLIVRIAQYLQT